MISFALIVVNDKTYLREGNGRWVEVLNGSIMWQESTVPIPQNGYGEEGVHPLVASELEAELQRKVLAKATGRYP